MSMYTTGDLGLKFPKTCFEFLYDEGKKLDRLDQKHKFAHEVTNKLIFCRRAVQPALDL